ncbi:uncharacterized protein LOC106881106 [Octopus bimaculoides]|uniref:Saposin B-type domain-containing protein n=1 Tax=Octopus bimaculoides TaxID=37653 RepID=A0A0L8FU70_OCTBM|nr:uncharacterized protein LOC106881106 [Octopus bimaculoides]|eukprot:XP_014786825.1 PREDICTED: uncharacterized protein LOC106881106 [Octopus bimaculoides]
MMDIKTCFTILTVVCCVQAIADTDDVKSVNKSSTFCEICQFTIKELDRWLQNIGRKGHYSIEAAVSKSLNSICNPNDNKPMQDDPLRLTACKELIANHGDIFKEAFIEHYESVEPVSYLRLIQDVCYKKLEQCQHDENQANVEPVKFNADNQMEIVETKNLRTLQPTEEQ